MSDSYCQTSHFAAMLIFVAVSVFCETNVLLFNNEMIVFGLIKCFKNCNARKPSCSCISLFAAQ